MALFMRTPIYGSSNRFFASLLSLGYLLQVELFWTKILFPLFCSRSAEVWGAVKSIVFGIYLLLISGGYSFFSGCSHFGDRTSTTSIHCSAIPMPEIKLSFLSNIGPLVTPKNLVSPTMCEGDYGFHMIKFGKVTFTSKVGKDVSGFIPNYKQITLGIEGRWSSSAK